MKAYKHLPRRCTMFLHTHRIYLSLTSNNPILLTGVSYYALPHIKNALPHITRHSQHYKPPRGQKKEMNHI